jgi:hypothetical protein
MQAAIQAVDSPPSELDEGDTHYLAAAGCVFGGLAKEAWLLTTSAKSFFAANGLRPVERADIPSATAATSQFKGACPSSTKLMRLVLA